MERHHFEKLDNDAALVIESLIRAKGNRPLTESDKEILAKFLLSLPARSPWGIALGATIAREVYGLSSEEDAKEVGLPQGQPAHMVAIGDTRYRSRQCSMRSRSTFARSAKSITVHRGRKEVPLFDIFKEDPPHVYFADGDMLVALGALRAAPRR